jgi:hypothetical protein
MQSNREKSTAIFLAFKSQYEAWSDELSKREYLTDNDIYEELKKKVAEAYFSIQKPEDLRDSIEWLQAMKDTLIYPDLTEVLDNEQDEFKRQSRETWVEIVDNYSIDICPLELPADDKTLAILLAQCAGIPAEINITLSLVNQENLSAEAYTQIAEFIGNARNKFSIDLTGLVGISVDDNANQQSSGLKKILTAIENKNSNRGSEIILDHCDLNSEHAVSIFSALKNTDNNVSISLAYNKKLRDEIQIQVPDPELANQTMTVTVNGAKVIGDALASGAMPSNLKLNLSNCKFTLDHLTDIVTALDSPKCPQGLQLNLMKNKYSDDTELNKSFIKNLATSMLKNTKVTELSISPDVGSKEDRDVISFCITRNQLLEKYPQHGALIKNICMTNKLFVLPENAVMKVPSLMSQVAYAARDGGAITSLASASIPEEVKVFLNDINKVSNELSQQAAMRPGKR